MGIRSLPEKERPLEKAMQFGIASLSTNELLAIIIHTGMQDRSALHLAEEVLACCPRGLCELGNLGMEDLMAINGIGKAKACNIMAAIELGKRMAVAPGTPRKVLGTAEEVAEMFMEKLRYEKKEHFKTVMLNAKGEVIGEDLVSVGELSSTVVHPREVFDPVLRKRASGVIFVHNHPSGDPKPSGDDLATTKRLVQSGEILGIRVLDHIIIGDGRYASMKAMDLM